MSWLTVVRALLFEVATFIAIGTATSNQFDPPEVASAAIAAVLVTIASAIPG